MSVKGITAAKLAREWGVSKNRIYQLVGEKRIRYVEGGGAIDYAHAQEFRKSQVARDPKRTLFTAHSNDGQTRSIEKSRLYAARSALGGDDMMAMPGADGDDLLDMPGLDDAQAVESQKVDPELTRSIVQNNRQNELKLRLLEEQLKRNEQRRLREEGRYILRTEAHALGAEAGKIVASMLRALPDQIAGTFAEPAAREGVRRKVLDTVERVQHSLYSRLSTIAGQGDDDAFDQVDDGFVSGFAEAIKPRAHLTLSQWAEENLILPAERSASPGPYRIGDASYQRGMLDSVSDHTIETVVFMTSSQVGKSTVLAAIEGYYAEWEPSPQLSVFPTQEVANDYVAESFDPMMKGSPALAKLFDKTAGAKGKQTADHKAYPGGYVAFVGANNPRDLAARPIRIVKCDEVDRFPLSAGKEGSPINLAFKRTETFFDRRKILSSTPTLKATSQITAWFERSDKRLFHVVCDDCGVQQHLKWANVHFKKGEEDDAVYACEGCGVLWSEFRKRRLVRDAEKFGGGWIATQMSPENIAGFHISALYSPWSSMAKMAKAWSAAEGRPEEEQTFYNTVLGLPYEGEVSSFADPEKLKQRREKYSPLMLNQMAAFITAGVDVQDDRIEILPVAWGLGDECWLLNPVVITRDPSTPQSWLDVEEALNRRYRHPGGKYIGVEAVAIDSGGHFTQTVYNFAAKHMKAGRRWYAVKGASGEKRPIWERSKMRMKDGRVLFIVGVDDAKTTIYKRYANEKPGPGYVHIHEGITDEQIAQLSAERAEVDYVHGFAKKTWTKDRSQRNELLDMFVYAYAARESWNGLDIDGRLRKLNDVVVGEKLTMFELGQRYK